MKSETMQSQFRDRNTLISISIASIVFFSPLLIILFVFNSHSDIIHGGEIFSNGIVFSAATAVLTRMFLRVIFVSGFFRIIFRGVFRSAFRVIGRVSVRLVGDRQTKIATTSAFSKNISKPDLKIQSTKIDIFYLTLAWVSLSASFIFVYWVVWGVIYWEGIAAISICLVVLYSSEAVYCNITKNEYDFSITKEGILIQAIFSLSLSFLPLVYDTNLVDGSNKEKGQMGVVGIVSLIILAIISLILHQFTNLTYFFATFQMAFLFVMMISFPVKPLEGGDIINWKKSVGIIIFIISLLGSSLLLEEAFINII